jgi:carbonic anhydrase
VYTSALYTGPQSIEQTVTQFNKAWAAGIVANYPNLLPTTAAKQTPKILWLGCCDSRVPETLISGLLPGEIFTHRNIGNIINPTDGSWPAALYYALADVGVSERCLSSPIVLSSSAKIKAGY